MSSIIEAATKFKAWAAEHGILSYDPPEDLDEYAGAEISDITDANQAAAATQTLQNKKINFIGVNDTEGKIIVCTHRKVSNKDIEKPPKEAEGGFVFEYIKAHRPVIRLPASSTGPATVFGVHNGRYTCGSSLSVGNCVTAGTLGCLVKDKDGVCFGLTNNHVSGGCGYSEQNLPIVAPGLVDVRPHGFDPFTIGHHFAVSPWVSGSPENAKVDDNLDAAIFRIKDPDRVTSMQRTFFDTPSKVATPTVGLAVEKVGRTTGRTHGTVVAKSVGYEPVGMAVPQFQGKIYFADVYVVQGQQGQPFAAPGDSGSLVCCILPGGSREAFGLVFAVSNDRQLTFVVPLSKILRGFNVSLVAGHNV